MYNIYFIFKIPWLLFYLVCSRQFQLLQCTNGMGKWSLFIIGRLSDKRASREGLPGVTRIFGPPRVSYTLFLINFPIRIFFRVSNFILCKYNSKIKVKSVINLLQNITQIIQNIQTIVIWLCIRSIIHFIRTFIWHILK